MSENGRPVRNRTLTERAQELYEDSVKKHKNNIQKSWKTLLDYIQENEKIDGTDQTTLKSVRNKTVELYNTLDGQATEFTRYLTSVSTSDSLFEITNLNSEITRYKEHTNSFLLHLQSLEDNNGERALSRNSRLSSKSKARKAAFAEKMAALDLAEIAVKRRLLQQTEDLESDSGESDELNSVKGLDIQVPQSVLTAQYITQLDPSVPPLDPSATHLNPSATQFAQSVPQLNPTAPTFVPPSGFQDLSRCLLRKDILTSRLTVFDEKPEHFHAWKSTFKSVVDEISVNSSEEIDLLLKWLGPTSKKHAAALKSAYVHKPDEALNQIWTRLEERFGSPEVIYHSATSKLSSFPKITAKNISQLYELSDILAEIEGLKADPKFSTILAFFDSAIGVNSVVNKLPHFLQEKWTATAVRYKDVYSVTYPPFSVFVKFICDQSKIRNDPGFMYESHSQPTPARGEATTTSIKSGYPKKTVSVRKSTVSNFDKCLIHHTTHKLEKCRVFLNMSDEERKKFMIENNLCFKCYSNQHMSYQCSKAKGSASSATNAPTSGNTASGASVPATPQSTEPVSIPQKAKPDTVGTSCTEICDSNSAGRSCSKIFPVNVSVQNNTKHVKCYCIIDEQSNRSLIKPELMSLLGITGHQHEYLLRTCQGEIVVSGRRANHVVVHSIDGSCSYNLPTLIECDNVPNDKHEICTPDMARYHDHLKHIASEIPEYDSQSDVLLLLGRDVIEVHHVFDQILGPPGTPFAQRLSFGWVVVGELCLGQIHATDVVNVNRTYILEDGRASLFQPCCDHLLSVKDPLFVQTPTDNKVSQSIDDREFLEIMDAQVCKNPDGSWVAPLPLRDDRPRLPNNRAQVVKRTNTLLKSLEKDPIKREHFFDFMDKLFSNGHAELAPRLVDTEECWYLPIFGVYHPKKPDQVRVVFDSSCQFEGVSLNSVLLPGPDLTNSLLGVLMRFRSDEVAMVADIEQMFYSFSVQERHRNLLRFLWFKDNDQTKALVEYRMCKHVFGNSPSPAIATYCLRKSVKDSQGDVKVFVDRDFYVDDGLTSQPSVDGAVDLIRRTQKDLSVSKLRLHKIASNDPELMKQFPNDDLAKGLKDVDLDCDDLPCQRSLGVVWNIESDKFMFKIDMSPQPVTKRGILSTINSLFDPLGFLAPVVLEGRLILRSLMSTKVDWDDPIPGDIARKWESWRSRLVDVSVLDIRRSYFIGSLSKMRQLQLHIFADASESAISAVVYIVGYSSQGDSQTGFVIGKSKLAPQKGHSIPRLELCAAVLATQLYQCVSEQLAVGVNDVSYYTDSKVVLGYICNRSRRFYQYVSNRVQKILQVSNPSQWNHVPGESNPADIGSRGASFEQLRQSSWLKGPELASVQHVSDAGSSPLPSLERFPLSQPEHDKEVRPVVSVQSTKVSVGKSFTSAFNKFSDFGKLVRAMSTLRHIAVSYHKRLPCKGWHLCPEAHNVQFREEVKCLILRKVQQEVYGKELDCLSAGRSLPRDSSVLTLDPKLGPDGLLRVGGRLSQSSLPLEEKYPIILPSNHHVTRLLVQHFHESVHHQGRLFTEGAVRQGGYWVVGGKRVVSSLIHNCVMCKKHRGKFQTQKMSDLPFDRVSQAAPFTYVGLDVFGPWSVVARKTRGGQSLCKRWAVLFTCLAIRAVHIEVIDEMSSSAFINALRRFISIRGAVRQFRSDRGSNFVGSTDHLDVNVINVEDEKTRSFLQSQKCEWVFNAPHSSHMGGSWERMIGISRRILESMLGSVSNLTHDVLTTLMAEVTSIINSRPIVPVSTDPDCPQVLSPSVLLTMKLDCEQIPLGNLDVKNLYKSHWKQVQYLASQFWIRWRKEYLQTLQCRRKWHSDPDPLTVGDIVLLRDKEVARNFWPIARITKTFPSEDNRIRKVQLCVIKEGKRVYYTRPIVETVLLVKCEN